MFSLFNKLLKKYKSNKNRENLRKRLVETNLDNNISYIKDLFTNSFDIEVRTFYIGRNQEFKAFIVAVDGLYNKDQVDRDLIRPLMSADFNQVKGKNKITYIKESLITINNINEDNYLEEPIRKLLNGDTILFIDSYDKVLVLDTRKYNTRAIEEPQSETVVRGPREGFIEDLRTNTTLIRRRIVNPKLKIEQLVIGKISQTDVAIIYIDGIANPKIIEEVRKRLKRINIDGILDSGFIEELIEDEPFSLFPTIAYTEKPQIVAARILAGRIAILADGSPVALTVPHLFIESLHNPDDFNSRPYFASFVRVIRFFALHFATFVPALYVAAIIFHNELIPTELMINIAAAREPVPFPLFLEVFIFVIGFEFLKEAGLRMPKHIGQAISIVGALILGEAAVNAGFAAAPTVIIIAVTSISGLMLPDFDELITILRLIFLLAAAILGIYGMMIFFTVLLFHLASLRSFGVPYMSPWFPLNLAGLGDFLIRVPLWLEKQRPEVFWPLNKTRQGDSQMPRKPGRRWKGGP